MLIYYGYTEKAAEYLLTRNLKPGDRVVLKLRDGSILRGILLPRPELYSTSNIINIKLSNGYNVGIDISKIESIEKEEVAVTVEHGLIETTMEKNNKAIYQE